MQVAERNFQSIRRAITPVQAAIVDSKTALTSANLTFKGAPHDWWGFRIEHPGDGQTVPEGSAQMEYTVPTVTLKQLQVCVPSSPKVALVLPFTAGAWAVCSLARFVVHLDAASTSLHLLACKADNAYHTPYTSTASAGGHYALCSPSRRWHHPTFCFFDSTGLHIA
jgi:hypothetical protein